MSEHDQIPLRADPQQIGAFVGAIFKHAEPGTFVSLRAFDQTDRTRPPLKIQSVAINNSFAGLVDAAARVAEMAANGQRSAVFAPPICTFNNASTARTVDVANGVSLSIDLDCGDVTAARQRLEHLLGPVTVAMHSGGDFADPDSGEVHDKTHLHWRLSEVTTTPAEHAKLQDARWLAAVLVNADTTASPSAHPLRWPGSWNTKSRPRLANIITINDDAEVHLDEALEKLQDAVEATGLGKAATTANKASGEPQASVKRISAAVALIPNSDVTWDEWVRLGMAAWRATGGSDQGRLSWTEWSSKSPKHNEAECVAQWLHFAKSPPSRIGAGTLFHLAKLERLRQDTEHGDRQTEGMTDARATAANDEGPKPAKREGKTKTNSRTEAGDGRPVIRVIAGELHTNATQAESAVIEAGLSIYQRGITLVRPIMQEVPASGGRMTVSASLVEMTPVAFIDTLCGCAVWVKYDGRSKAWLRINPPKQVADIIMSRVGAWTFFKVAGVITTPTIRPDGSILSEAGYDPATRLFHMADPTVHLSPLVQNPTRRTAEQALQVLLDLLVEFPFTSDVSRAVALSALITPVTRGALTVAPMHVFRASTAGSGKSYLVDTASAIASGRPCPVAAAGPDEIETEKRLIGLLLSGFPLVSLDNVNGELGGDTLCQAIERPLIRVRRLGASDIIEIESRATLFGTGNALRVRGDMTRRTLLSDLDANMERPELREFKADPIVTIMADRGRYISACLVIVRAYILAGQPGMLPPLASFSDWSNLVRSALVWLGCADPAASMDQAREDDPELTELREVVAAWKNALSIGDAMTVKDLADTAEAHRSDDNGLHSQDYSRPELREALHKIAGERGVLNTRRLASWLSKRAGRIVDGYRITKAVTATTGGVVRWALTSSAAQ